MIFFLGSCVELYRVAETLALLRSSCLDHLALACCGNFCLFSTCCTTYKRIHCRSSFKIIRKDEAWHFWSEQLHWCCLIAFDLQFECESGQSTLYLEAGNHHNFIAFSLSTACPSRCS